MNCNEGNKIQIIITKEINAAILKQNIIVILKISFKKIIDKQNEKIVLKKIEP
jgi:hypothetical protein